MRNFFRKLFGTDELYDGAVKTIRKFAMKFVDHYYIDGGSNNGHAKDEREALVLLLKMMEKKDEFYLFRLDDLLNNNIELDQNNRKYQFGMESHKAYPSPNLSCAVRSMLESKGENGWVANPYEYIIKDILNNQGV